jgi:predicted Holliday junction resolvase-like endonuclease
MHFVDDQIRRVGQVDHGRVVGCPGPGAGVVVAFDEDVLRCCAGIADAVDGCLVEGYDDGFVEAVVFVVWRTSADELVKRRRKFMLTCVENDIVV